MTKELTATFGLSMGLLALVSVLPVYGLAQSGNAGVTSAAADAIAARTSKAGGAVVVESRSTDMRLWSFGDCDKNFPYVNSPEHQECVRVVGSEEAKDARAIHYCDVSHAKDPTEATQCKTAYFANKSEAEHEGFRANPANSAPVVAAAAPAPKRDKAAEIAALTRALTAPDPDEPPATSEPAPDAAPATAAPPPSSTSAGTIMVWLAIMLLLAGIGVRYRHKFAAMESAPRTPSRSHASPGMASGTPRKRY